MHEITPTHTRHHAVPVRMCTTDHRTVFPTTGRDTPVCPGRFWRDTYIHRITLRYRLPLPIQKIINMLLLLIRNQPQGQAVHGNLFIQQHEQGKTILTHLCTTLENQQYIIPALFYNISVTRSPKFGRLLPLLNQVPQRSGIRLHVGTKPEHSTGCILLPDRRTEQQLTQQLLYLQQNHETIILEIKYQTPVFPDYRHADDDDGTTIVVPDNTAIRTTGMHQRLPAHRPLPARQHIPVRA